MKTAEFHKLTRLNLVAAILHLVQGFVILTISTSFKLPLTLSYLSFDYSSKSLVPASHKLLDIPLAWLLAAFLFMSSFAHFSVVSYYRRTYQDDLMMGLNKARWIEYSVSASIMMVAIALLVGIYDLGSLVMIFVLVAGMNLMGLVMEVHNQTTKQTNWLSFWSGVLLGATPWIVVGLYFVGAAQFGSGQIPAFVYWIYVSIFVFFNCFAINMYLQYKKIGPWKDYLFGEKVYIFLSLIAKSALAWQVFAGTLRP